MISKLDWKGIAVLGIAVAAYVAVAVFAPDYLTEVATVLAGLGLLNNRGALKRGDE